MSWIVTILVKKKSFSLGEFLDIGVSSIVCRFKFPKAFIFSWNFPQVISFDLNNFAGRRLFLREFSTQKSTQPYFPISKPHKSCWKHFTQAFPYFHCEAKMWYYGPFLQSGETLTTPLSGKVYKRHYIKGGSLPFEASFKGLFHQNLKRQKIPRCT